MKNLTIVGAQWGDEGKGKIVDHLCGKFDAVLRFQGGHNAGHTIVIGKEKFILSILPSGLIRNKLCIIGSSVVIDPIHLLNEINLLKKKKINISTNNLKIANNASILLPFHSLIDKAREKELSKKKIGTTGRGIGPCYEDKIARRGLKIYDLEDTNTLKTRLNNLINFHNIFLKSVSQKKISFKKTFKLLLSIRKKILPFSVNINEFVNSKLFFKKKLLFEGAQGLMLDIDHGTFPFVTSSNTIPATAASSLGLKPSKIGHILGIMKAYTTRVGEGPFPTELKSNIGLELAKNGHEFGSVTGRPRRCGWFDAVQCKKAINIAGIDFIALTKIDVLDNFEEIKICYKYKMGKKNIDFMPSSNKDLNNVKPLYKTLKGWCEKTTGIKNKRNLPKKAQKFIKVIEALLNVPIVYLSNGPERNDIINLKRIT
ncbi:MAG: Adenylosuccinate synthetase [Alphaproteobacteria bacterium MarineAlpha6_Bin3]|nr:MAG: Adenylosuccinate synthetase [Alphaproteobacteria bacterium MarineAlpha6_Bin3]|tara:strand:- start:19897 stop:21180 length:1284 start_codon:yes stop_codon:yes gene_type:complete